MLHICMCACIVYILYIYIYTYTYIHIHAYTTRPAQIGAQHQADELHDPEEPQHSDSEDEGDHLAAPIVHCNILDYTMLYCTNYTIPYPTTLHCTTLYHDTLSNPILSYPYTLTVLCSRCRGAAAEGSTRPAGRRYIIICIHIYIYIYIYIYI